jgi:hypothetical protein
MNFAPNCATFALFRQPGARCRREAVRYAAIARVLRSCG